MGPVSYVGDYVKPRQLIALVQKLKLYSKYAFTYENMKMLKNYRTEYYRLYYQGREVAGQEGQKNHAEHFYKP
jgi:hypothetical protein